MEKRLNAVQLAAILRIWSITADKDIPLDVLADWLERNPYKDVWLDISTPIIEFVDWMDLDPDKYEIIIAAIIHWQFTRDVGGVFNTNNVWSKFLSMHPKDQKVWLDEARKRISEC